ncbi:hypothetical protein KM043_017791 [Ampulex compressa]|nr:hypothetical protein KM043_017791 [Ampulex compressa]
MLRSPKQKSSVKNALNGKCAKEPRSKKHSRTRAQNGLNGAWPPESNLQTRIILRQHRCGTIVRRSTREDPTKNQQEQHESLKPRQEFTLSLFSFCTLRMNRQAPPF